MRVSLVPKSQKKKELHESNKNETTYILYTQRKQAVHQHKAQRSNQCNKKESNGVIKKTWRWHVCWGRDVKYKSF